MRHHQHLAHPALLPLWRSLERDGFLQLLAIMGLLLCAFAGLLIGMRGHPLVLLLATGLTITGFVLLYRHFRRPSPLLRLQDFVYDHPHTIVWVYTIIHQHHPFGLEINERGIIYFKLADGDEISAYLPPNKLKLITKVLSRALPNTVFGYTKEREAQYTRNPQSLKK